MCPLGYFQPSLCNVGSLQSITKPPTQIQNSFVSIYSFYMFPCCKQISISNNLYTILTSLGCFSWSLFLPFVLVSRFSVHWFLFVLKPVSFGLHASFSLFMSQLLLILVPVSSWPRVLPCLGAIVSLFLSQCLLVHEWVSPCSSASFSLSFASFFLSLYGFLQVPVSPCPRYSFSSSSFQFFSCPHVSFSLSLCQFASFLSSIFWFLLVLVPPCTSFSCSVVFFFLGKFFLSSTLILFYTRYRLITLE